MPSQPDPTPPQADLPSYTAFDGSRRLGSGPLSSVALAAAQALRQGASGPVLVFDDRSGAVVDIDTRGSDAELLARLGPPAEAAAGPAPGGEPAVLRGRGRPRLGVVAREVTLLPRHWDWLAAQPGGASVALRKLVEGARRAQGDKDRRRQRHERTYRFMSAMAGDFTGFEEACRALFADDRARFLEHSATWPDDVRAHCLHLAFDDAGPAAGADH